mgnify:CR=1 FL=1
METKSYLEIKTPISSDAQWLCELKKTVHGVNWQNGFYHITVAFFNEMDEMQIGETKQIIDSVIKQSNAQQLSIDSINAFTTKGGATHVIYTTSSRPKANLMQLINLVRQQLIEASINVEPDFKLHITLGRISSDKISLGNLQHKLSTVSIPSFNLNLSEFEYRYFRGSSIQKWHLE